MSSGYVLRLETNLIPDQSHYSNPGEDVLSGDTLLLNTIRVEHGAWGIWLAQVAEEHVHIGTGGRRATSLTGLFHFHLLQAR